MGRSEGRVAVVTGGTRGIGKAILLRLASERANVVAVSRSIDCIIEETLKMVKQRNVQGIHVRADISSTDQVKQMVQKVKKTFGRIDILVNNALFQIMSILRHGT